MSGEPSRRSSRAKKPKSYRFEDEYAFLDEHASDQSASQASVVDEISESDDFRPDAQVGEEEQDDGSDDDFDENEDGGEDNEDSEEDSDQEPTTLQRVTATDISVVEEDPSDDTHVESGRKRQRMTNDLSSPIPFVKGNRIKVHAQTAARLRTRGVADFSKIGGQEIRLKDLFGPRSEDLKPILATRDYWSIQETLPLRQEGGLRRSFFESDDARAKETQILRTWYAEFGESAFARGQTSNKLSADETLPYCTTPSSNCLNILWGAIDKPQLRSLKRGDYANISEPWIKSKDRRGWLFNMGSRIQEAQWATNEECETQYLAIAVEQKPNGRQPPNLENPKAPAFSATSPFKTSIQIWAFEATDNGALDTLAEPRLQVLVCTEWGAPKQLRWCPIKAREKEEDSTDVEHKHIGLLAGIWSDGKTRILDISISESDIDNAEPLNLFFSRAAFEVSLPNTVPTCLHWLSGTSLAIASAAGTVGIWTLTRSDTLPSVKTDTYVPKPWFYQQLAGTYILTMTSGWPSQPHLLSISVADGFAQLYDIRSPHADTTVSIRGRTLCISQAWHEQTQSFAMPDEFFILKHNPIRRYYHNLYTMRLESSITRVATSPVHPSILIGGAEGNVEASNPVGRITNYKVIPWQQKWFVHEWRGPVNVLVTKPPSLDVEMSEAGPVQETTCISAANSDDNPAVSIAAPTKVPPEILSQPLVRITEGYKATQPGIQHSVASKKPANHEIGKGITVFEENSAITVLAWNPNLHYGTWAVAGMASGLLRVEDIGV